MCKILQFPTKENNAYRNLIQFFEVCDTVKSCNFYLESAEVCYKEGYITEKELYTLRRIGRTKRAQLATPEKPAAKVTAPGVYSYTPEIGEKKPNCQIEASLSYYGKHYHLYTALELKGRGISRAETGREGLNCYTATKKAFEKLKEVYTISYKMAY